jgi:hypothetical protein
MNDNSELDRRGPPGMYPAALKGQKGRGKGRAVPEAGTLRCNLSQTGDWSWLLALIKDGAKDAGFCQTPGLVGGEDDDDDLEWTLWRDRRSIFTRLSAAYFKLKPPRPDDVDVFR